MGVSGVQSGGGNAALVQKLLNAKSAPEEAQAQVEVMKKAQETKKESILNLLNSSLGVGQNVDRQA